jgi:hypothetical protein
LLITDQDGHSKQQRKFALQERLGERYKMLDCREIENSLPSDVIRQVVATYEKEELASIPIVQPVDYKEKYLGTYIDQVMLGGNPKRKGGYADSTSGTLKNKPEFCRRAIPLLHYEDLPEPTQTIIQDMYQFIVRQNQP